MIAEICGLNIVTDVMLMTNAYGYYNYKLFYYK